MAKSTIEDVARLAGVSIKTVSRVVNQEPNVRESTRKSVQKAISQLGYRPDQSARSLRSRRSYLIGLVYDDHIARRGRLDLGIGWLWGALGAWMVVRAVTLMWRYQSGAWAITGATLR